MRICFPVREYGEETLLTLIFRLRQVSQAAFTWTLLGGTLMRELADPGARVAPLGAEPAGRMRRSCDAPLRTPRFPLVVSSISRLMVPNCCPSTSRPGGVYHEDGHPSAQNRQGKMRVRALGWPYLSLIPSWGSRSANGRRARKCAPKPALIRQNRAAWLLRYGLMAHRSDRGPDVFDVLSLF